MKKIQLIMTSVVAMLMLVLTNAATQAEKAVTVKTWVQDAPNITDAWIKPDISPVPNLLQPDVNLLAPNLIPDAPNLSPAAKKSDNMTASAMAVSTMAAPTEEKDASMNMADVGTAAKKSDNMTASAMAVSTMAASAVAASS